MKWDGEEGLDAISRFCAAASLLVGKQGIIERVDPTLFELPPLPADLLFLRIVRP